MAAASRRLSAALRVLALWTLLASAFAAADSSNSEAQQASTTHGGTESEFVRVILLGATGNLAAKYLWVASFRLALQSYEQRNAPQFEFIAAATNSQAYGEQWKTQLFDAAFRQRVCGDGNSSREPGDVHSQCEAFFNERFVPNVQYAQLRDETHYERLADLLAQQDIVLPGAAATEQARTVSRVEVGRLVYLAIPPSFFAQVSAYGISCSPCTLLVEIVMCVCVCVTVNLYICCCCCCCCLRRAASSRTSTCDRRRRHPSVHSSASLSKSRSGPTWSPPRRCNFSSTSLSRCVMSSSSQTPPINVAASSASLVNSPSSPSRTTRSS